MGTISNGSFISSYYGDQIDALLAAMAQANPLPSGTNWVAFIDDCREAQSIAIAAKTLAQTAATNAASSATTASNRASQASSSANTAYSYSNSAASSAATASVNAAQATNSAARAANSATAAAGSAAQAASAASTAATQTASQIRAEMEGYTDEAESWAVGGTGTRTGEDTDNSKYYCERAEAAAEQASVPPVEGVYNIILADRVTSAKYALVLYNGRLTAVGVAASAEATDMTLIDAATGINYTLVANNGRICLEEV